MLYPKTIVNEIRRMFSVISTKKYVRVCLQITQTFLFFILLILFLLQSDRASSVDAENAQTL